MFFLIMIPPLIVLYEWKKMMKENKPLYDSINHQLKRDYGKDIFEYCEGNNNGIFHPAIIGVAAVISPWGIAGANDLEVAWGFIIATGVAWAISRSYYRVLTYMKPIITSHEAHEKERQQQRRNDEHVRQNTFDVDDDEQEAGEFGFDAGRFGAKPPPPQPDENAPRGYDKRHPDDAKFWAFVDDPETPENEAISALRKIRERERQRKKRGIPPT